MSAAGGAETEAVQRVVDGRFVVYQRRPYGTGPTHGLASTYRSQFYACRCGPCREANSALQKREDARRREMLAADPSLVEHGLVSTYINWGCRCETCGAAHSARLKRQRESRYARLKADPSIVKHGRLATYSGWACRCDECVAAAKAARRPRALPPPP